MNKWRILPTLLLALSLNSRAESVVEAKFVNYEDVGHNVCSSTDRELLVTYDVERALTGNLSGRIAVTRCYHNDLNPYVRRTLVGQDADVIENWLLVLTTNGERIFEEREFEILRDSKNNKVICPAFISNWLVQRGVHIEDIKFDDLYDIELRDAPLVLIEYYKDSQCYDVIGKRAKRAKGIYVSDIETSFKKK